MPGFTPARIATLRTESCAAPVSGKSSRPARRSKRSTLRDGRAIPITIRLFSYTGNIDEAAGARPRKSTALRLTKSIVCGQLGRCGGRHDVHGAFRFAPLVPLIEVGI